MKHYKFWCSNSELELVGSKAHNHHVKQTGNSFPKIQFHVYLALTPHDLSKTECTCLFHFNSQLNFSDCQKGFSDCGKIWKLLARTILWGPCDLNSSSLD